MDEKSSPIRAKAWWADPADDRAPSGAASKNWGKDGGDMRGRAVDRLGDAHSSGGASWAGSIAGAFERVC
ncbi:MAG: hypothetical protein CME06_10000 [Gemmatimonadetes bacterium]|nr:hypothetical protein [Gemmatimonadota bacterium]